MTARSDAVGVLQRSTAVRQAIGAPTATPAMTTTWPFTPPQPETHETSRQD